MIHQKVHISTVLTAQFVTSNFPVLSDILGEVGTFCTVYLSISSRTYKHGAKNKMARIF